MDDGALCATDPETSVHMYQLEDLLQCLRFVSRPKFNTDTVEIKHNRLKYFLFLGQVCDKALLSAAGRL